MQIRLSLLAVAAFGILLFGCNSHPTVTTQPANQVNNTVGVVDSLSFYEDILKDDSLNTELRIALASNYYAAKKFDEAIHHLLIVHQIDPKNEEAMITLGNVYYDSEQYDNAIIYYEKALALDKKNVDVRCDLATCYLNEKKTDQAYKLLKKNLEINPNHAQSHHNLSVVYDQMGKTKEAEAEMKIFNSLQK